MIQTRPRPAVGASPLRVACSPDSSARIASPGIARPDRVDDQLLGEVVDLGDDVAGALVVDPLEPLVAIHEQPAGRQRRSPSRTRARRRSARRARWTAGAAASRRRQSTASGRTAVPNSGDRVIELDRRVRGDPRGQDERRLAAALERRVDDPAGRRARHSTPRSSPRSETISPPSSDRTSTTSAGNGPIPATASGRRARGRRSPSPTATKTVPWTCELAESLQPERIAALAQADVERDRRAAAGAGVGQLGRRRGAQRDSRSSGRSSVRQSCHEPGRGAVAARRESAYQRSTAPTSASTSAVVRAVRTIAVRAGLEPARQLVARGDDERVARTSGSASLPTAPAKPEHDPLLGSLPAGRRQRLEVARPRSSNVSDSAAQPSPISAAMPDAGRRARPDEDRRRRVRDRVGVGVLGAGRTRCRRVTGPPVHSARMTATASSRWTRPLRRRREVDPVRLVLRRDGRRSRSRATSRPPLAIWSVDAIRARTAGWRFMTFVTNVPTVTRSVTIAAAVSDRPGLDDRVGLRRPGR